MPVETTPPRDPFAEMDEVARRGTKRFLIIGGIVLTVGVIFALTYLGGFF